MNLMKTSRVTAAACAIAVALYLSISSPTPSPETSASELLPSQRRRLRAFLPALLAPQTVRIKSQAETKHAPLNAVDHVQMRDLKLFLMAQKTALSPREWDKEAARLFLHFLKTKATDMFPLLGEVPSTVSPGAPDGTVEFVGQELEDKIIYEKFLNENTLHCHTFGDVLFESGAFKGVLLR